MITPDATLKSHIVKHPIRPPGIYVKPGKDRDTLAAMLLKEGYVPVWLEPQLLDLYYNGEVCGVKFSA
jgi:hypothetical protein